MISPDAPSNKSCHLTARLHFSQDVSLRRRSDAIRGRQVNSSVRFLLESVNDATDKTQAHLFIVILDASRQRRTLRRLGPTRTLCGRAACRVQITSGGALITSTATIPHGFS
jgi:hypothetical protein